MRVMQDWEKSHLKAETRQLVQMLQCADWPVMDRRMVSDAQAADLSEFLRGYLIYHLEALTR